MLLAAHCGPSGFTAIADDGQRFKGQYLAPLPAHLKSDGSAAIQEGEDRNPVDSPIRLRQPHRFDAMADSRFDPARMTDEERAGLLAAEVQNDSQPVLIAIRLFHRLGWSIRDLLDDNSQPVPKVEPYVAYSRLPVVGESEGYSMPQPILSPARSRFADVQYAIENCRQLGEFLSLLARRFEPVPFDPTPASRLGEYVMRQYAKRHTAECGS